MKNFNTQHNQDYYRNWVYLGSLSFDNKAYDYYCKIRKGESDLLSIVYGDEPQQYISGYIANWLTLEDPIYSNYCQLFIKYCDTHNINFVKPLNNFIRGKDYGGYMLPIEKLF